MKKRSLIIFVALALVPLILLAQISSPGSYSSVIMTFLRSTTAAAARSAIGAVNSGSGGALTNAVIYGSTSGSTTFGSLGQIAISDGSNGAGLLGVYFSADTDTGFYRPGANELSIVAGGVERLNVTSVGIKLSTFGTATTPSIYINGDSNTGPYWLGSDTFGITTGGTTKLYFTASENVGINTTGPDKAFEINSATGACLQLTYNDSNGSAANKVTFDVSSGGDLTIAPSGSDISFTGRTASTPTSSTIAAAATTLAITRDVMTITGDAGGNTVATITGGLSGQILTLIFTDSLVTITDDATGNANTVNLSAAFTSTSNDTLTLVFNGTSWREVARSVN